MAVTVPALCRAIAISPSRGSHRAMMLTTRSRALLKTRNAAATDNLTRCVPFCTCRKPRHCRQSYPLPSSDDRALQCGH
jgi:hypothetical protein